MASVREDWKGNKAGLRTRVFNDGISNALIGVYKVTCNIIRLKCDLTACELLIIVVVSLGIVDQDSLLYKNLKHVFDLS